MGRKIEELLLNPFAKRVVDRPRGIDITVEGLNARVLLELQAEFAGLLQGSPPRARLRKDEVQLVMSADPGYGKSHLIGRLFNELKHSATRIYVRPFTDPSNAWSSTLSRLVQEMSLPEDGGADSSPNGEPTQMDAFGQAVLAQAFLELVRRSAHLAPANAAVLERLSGVPLSGFDLGNAGTPEARWMGSLTEDELNEAACLLPALGVDLQPGSSAETWLRVLFLYVADRTQVQRRSLCLEWVEAKLHRSDVGELGLSQRAGLDDDVDRSGRNDEARARVLDLCALAGLFRPFLICFDQTETYGQRPGLARAFGNLVADLYQEAPNQMTVVTANEDKWKRDIKPHVDSAHLERFGWPRYLEEITPDQSRELARRRLEFCGVEETEIQRFVEPGWLQQAVPPGGVSVRRFLEEAAQRFSTLSRQKEGQDGLADLLKSEKLELTGQRRKLRQYQGDLYRWALLDVPRAAHPGFTANSFESHRDYFPVMWHDESAGRVILFGFEERENHRTWEAIAKEARRQREQSRGQATVIMIRLETQPSIPPDGWAVAPLIREVMRENLRIESVADERLLTVHALWELYSSACQGNIGSAPDEVLRLAAQHLAPWWAELRDSATSSACPAPARPLNQAVDPLLSRLVEAIIRERRFIGEEDLISEARARSGKLVNPSEIQEISRLLGNRVHVQAGEGTRAYIWQG